MLFRCGRLEGILAERWKISQLVCSKIESKSNSPQKPTARPFLSKSNQRKAFYQKQEFKTSLGLGIRDTWGPWTNQSKLDRKKVSKRKKERGLLEKGPEKDRLAKIEIYNLMVDPWLTLGWSLVDPLVDPWLILDWFLVDLWLISSMVSSSRVSPLGWTAVLSHRPLLPRPE